MVHRYNANNENKTNNNTSQKRIEFILRNCWRCEFGTVLQLKIQQKEDKIFKTNRIYDKNNITEHEKNVRDIP